MDSLALARALHVLAVVIWIGGVSVVTTAFLPALRGGELGADWLTTFQAIERRFVWQARAAIIIVGATGLYMIVQADLWDRFRSADYWWMHAMVALWTLFAIGLFVLEPLFLDRRLRRCDPARRSDRRSGALKGGDLMAALVTRPGLAARPPLTPLELRLERGKCFSNTKLDFLKRLHDGASIVERYRRVKIDIHVHFLASDGIYCAEYRARCSRAGEPSTDINCGHSDNEHQFPVFVSVRGIAEQACPIASIVRLQPLDCCDMAGVEALETGLCPPPEVLWRVFDRKLRTVLRDAGIEFGEFKNEVFEGGSQVVANFSYQDGDGHRGRLAQVSVHPIIPPSIRLEIGNNGLLLLRLMDGDQGPKISKVFVCPIGPVKCAIERMRRHGAISGKSV